MNSTCNLVAETIWADIASSLSVNDDQLSMLHFLFGRNLERATRIVDLGGVKKICGHPSGRSIFQVVGESRRKEEYFCFPEHYCACYSYFYDVVNRGEQLCGIKHIFQQLKLSLDSKTEWVIKEIIDLTRPNSVPAPGCVFKWYLMGFFYGQCKHQLAARLAEALGTCVEVKVPDKELALMLSSL